MESLDLNLKDNESPVQLPKKLDRYKEILKGMRMLERNSKFAKSMADTRNLEDFDGR